MADQQPAADRVMPILPPPPQRVLNYLALLGFDTKNPTVSKSGFPVYFHTAWPRHEGRFEDSVHHNPDDDSFNPLWVSAVRRVASTAVWSSVRSLASDNGLNGSPRGSGSSMLSDGFDSRPPSPPPASG